MDLNKLCCDFYSNGFQRALKEFIARRGCRQTIVSDNGKTSSAREVVVYPPFLYQGEEFEQPVLNPNTLLRGKPSPILEEDFQATGVDKVTKRMKSLQKSKEQLPKRGF